MSIYYQKQSEGEGALELEVSKIVANPNQPRKVFASESILKLADSISEHGIIQPLIVRRTKDGYELIAGERRLRAAKELGLRTVPCIISQISDEKSAEASIIENLIREDLSFFEEAMAIENLIDTYSLTQEELARRLSCSQSCVANKLRLLRFSKEEREKILSAGLSERHARALLRISDEDKRMKTLERVILLGLNVLKTEEFVEGVLTGNSENSRKVITKGENEPKTPLKRSVGAFYSAIERTIDTYKGSGVNIKSRKIENDDYTEITIVIGNQRVKQTAE